MFKPNVKQQVGLRMLSSPAKHILFFGGSRSGKTALLVEAIIARSLKHPKSRHLIARLRFSHAKTSIWHESLIPALKAYRELEGAWIEHRQDYYLEFTNGSEIWVGGFDDKERTEKLLGHEYATIYLNEVSQIAYDTKQLIQTRLAQKIDGLINKAYYDCNPPSPLHWAHKLFIEKIDPIKKDRLSRPELYASLLMNPDDNKENLPDHYIEDMLDTLPDRARARFRYGQWVKAEGAIYSELAQDNIIPASAIPRIEEYTVGIDFGLNMAGVLIGWAGENIYCITDMMRYNYTSSEFDKEFRGLEAVIGRRKVKIGKLDYTAYCDPSGGERIQEITNGEKANNSVDPGIDFINKKIHNKQFYICENCTNLISEIFDYRRDEKERIVKENDHCTDSMRYGIFSRIAGPKARVRTI